MPLATRLAVEERPSTSVCSGGGCLVFTADNGGVLRPLIFRVKVWLPGGPGTARRGPGVAHGRPGNEEGPAVYRARAGVIGVRRQGLEPRTVALRARNMRAPDLRRKLATSLLSGPSLTRIVCC